MAKKNEIPVEPGVEVKSAPEPVIIKPTASLKAATEEVTVLKEGLTHGGEPVPVGARISLRVHQVAKLKSKGIVK